MGSAGDAGVMCDKHASSCAVEDVFMIVLKYMLHPLLSFCFPFSRWLFLLFSQSVPAVVLYLAFVVVAMCFSLPVCLLKSTHKYVT